MKLGEALALRADIQVRFDILRERLRASALIQEGTRPPEDPDVLLTELSELSDQLERLIVQINRTNLQAHLPTGESLTEALARRDVLKYHQSALQTIVDAASTATGRYSKSEIRYIPTVNVAGLRRKVDDFAKQRREIDTSIQAVNWTQDLLESS